MKTLVVVDVQNDFTPGGALAVPDGDAIVPLINQLQDKFDLIVATQDWHPADHASFASNHEGKNAFEKIDLHGMEQVLWPDHCIQGSEGAEFHPDLEMRKVESIFRKGMDQEIDSYSGFYDNGHRKNTGLAGYLREKGATELYFCGLAADICVYFSVKDALKEEFSTILIEDATRPLDENEFKRIKDELREKEVQIMKSSEVN